MEMCALWQVDLWLGFSVFRQWMDVQGGRAGHNRCQMRAAEPCQRHLTSLGPETEEYFKHGSHYLSARYILQIQQPSAYWRWPLVKQLVCSSNLPWFSVLHGFYSLILFIHALNGNLVLKMGIVKNVAYAGHVDAVRIWHFRIISLIPVPLNTCS